MRIISITSIDMKSVASQAARKRPYNLLLSEQTVRDARHYTDNLSATVESLLAGYVEEQSRTRADKQAQADAITEAWNRFNDKHGSFADEYSTL